MIAEGQTLKFTTKYCCQCHMTTQHVIFSDATSEYRKCNKCGAEATLRELEPTLETTDVACAVRAKFKF